MGKQTTKNRSKKTRQTKKNNRNKKGGNIPHPPPPPPRPSAKKPPHTPKKSHVPPSPPPPPPMTKKAPAKPKKSNLLGNLHKLKKASDGVARFADNVNKVKTAFSPLPTHTNEPTPSQTPTPALTSISPTAKKNIEELNKIQAGIKERKEALTELKKNLSTLPQQPDSKPLSPSPSPSPLPSPSLTPDHNMSIKKSIIPPAHSLPLLTSASVDEKDGKTVGLKITKQGQEEVIPVAELTKTPGLILYQGKPLFKYDEAPYQIYKFYRENPQFLALDKIKNITLSMDEINKKLNGDGNELTGEEEFNKKMGNIVNSVQ